MRTFVLNASGYLLAAFFLPAIVFFELAISLLTIPIRHFFRLVPPCVDRTRSMGCFRFEYIINVIFHVNLASFLSNLVFLGVIFNVGLAIGHVDFLGSYPVYIMALVHYFEFIIPRKTSISDDATFSPDFLERLSRFS